MAWTILWIPFIAAVLITLFLLNKPRAAGWLATGVLFAGFICTLRILSHAQFESLNHSPLESSIVWLSLGGHGVIEFGILLNGLSILMLLIVTGIGSLIFLYSISYMKEDKSAGRYFACLSLFAFSMLGIVLANNLVQVFIFWELVGLSSYLLIGFWYEKDSAAMAGKKAFLTNRVGDIGMMIGILLLFHQIATNHIGSVNFLTLEGRLPHAGISEGMLAAISLLIFCGVMGKSAQVPLHVWLPDAMEGPTPVSALMHAATMVAAGVFLLARLYFLFAASPSALHIIAWIGVVTAFLAGTMALVQNDIKKILAYSTLSQLGYMVMAIGLADRNAGMFHLTTHAFFKALLFLAAGSLIHGMHTQDIWEMRRFPKTLKHMLVTSFTFLMGTLALMGIPPFSGYFSKEEILSAATHGPKLLLIIALSVVFLTAFYMGRLCTIVFFSQTAKEEHHHAHESDGFILFPLAVLAVFSIAGGYLPIKEILGHSAHAAAHHGGNLLAIISVSLGLIGFGTAFLVFRKAQGPVLGENSFPSIVLDHKYFFDELYDDLIRYGQESIATFSDAFERHVVVQFASNGTASAARSLGQLLSRLQTGVVQFYALVFAVGVTVLVFLLMLR